MPATPEALRDFEAACSRVLEEWAGALSMSSSDAEADARGMSDDGLLRAVASLAALGRRVEALQVRCAAVVASRSRGVDAESGLAKRGGFASAERLLADARGTGYADAARLVAVGEATSRRASFTGEALPARHPQLASALDNGVISVGAADQIRRFLDRVPPTADRDDTEAAEQLLVERAPVVGVDGLTRLIKQLEAYLDPDGVKPREDELRSRRTLTVWEDAAGMINLRGAFDPANGAPIKLAIETLVGAELHRARDARAGFGEHDTAGASDAEAAPDSRAARASSAEDDGATGVASGGAPDPSVAEQRSIGQMNADALADIARLSLASSDAPPSLRNAVVVTRIDADALESGTGHATIDGIDQPISVSSASELIASAGLARLVLGSAGEVLDLGRTTRFFTPAQKVALAERDGGCAWPGCLRPPSHTQAHHIAWWRRDHGPTNLENGIMLCSHHHHRVHDDGWTIRIREHRSWFIPPAHLDPEQRPRAGNAAPRHLIRARLGPTRSDGRARAAKVVPNAA